MRKSTMKYVLAAQLLWGWSVPNASATPILDQSFVPGGMVNGLCADIGGPPALICGQQFTVGVTGTLVSTELYLLNFALVFPSGIASVGLYDATGLLSLIETSPTPLAVSGAGAYSFAFNTPVTAGQVLAVAFSVEGASVAFGTTYGDQYPNGRARVQSRDTDFSDSVSDADLYFKTFVEPSATVPEPMLLSLFGIALTGVAARLRRRRS